jgi:predicted Zn-dependent protease
MLKALEMQWLGRTFPQESPGNRLSRLEKTIGIPPSPNQPLPYRMARLVSSQQTAMTQHRNRQAIQAYNLGVDYAARGQVEPALDAYRKALQINPKFMEAYNNMAHLLEKVQRFKEAIQVYERALKQAPAIPPGQKSEPMALMHRNLAIVYERIGAIEPSLEQYRQYLKLSTQPDPSITRVVQEYRRQREEGTRSPHYADMAREGSNGQTVLWDKKLNPIPVFIQMEEDQLIFLQAVKEALQSWQQASAGRLQFQEVGYPVQALITIKLQEGPLSHPYLNVGLARFDVADPDSQNNPKNLRVSVTVNTGERNLPISLEDRLAQVKRLTLHEIGHAVGIWGHSPDPGDVMYSRPIASTLSARDVETLRTLYTVNKAKY